MCCRAYLHAVEAHEVVQLGIPDDIQVHQEEQHQGRPLAQEVIWHQWLCIQRKRSVHLEALSAGGVGVYLLR